MGNRKIKREEPSPLVLAQRPNSFAPPRPAPFLPFLSSLAWPKSFPGPLLSSPAAVRLSPLLQPLASGPTPHFRCQVGPTCRVFPLPRVQAGLCPESNTGRTDPLCWLAPQVMTLLYSNLGLV